MMVEEALAAAAPPEEREMNELIRRTSTLARGRRPCRAPSRIPA
jgi:hypothetical protein